MLKETYGAGLALLLERLLLEAINHCFHGSLAGERVRFQASRVESFRHEVTTKDTPSNAIGGSPNIFVLVTENIADRDDWWTICKDGTVFNKGFVGDGVGGDENKGFRANE